MTRYYEEVDRLTYREAEHLVTVYLESVERRTVTVKHVARFAGTSTTQHNVHRLTEALKDRCDVADEGPPKRYEVQQV